MHAYMNAHGASHHKCVLTAPLIRVHSTLTTGLLAVGGFVVMMTREALPIAADSTTLSRSGARL
jgi:hypothetical protein